MVEACIVLMVGLDVAIPGNLNFTNVSISGNFDAAKGLLVKHFLPNTDALWCQADQ